MNEPPDSCWAISQRAARVISSGPHEPLLDIAQQVADLFKKRWGQRDTLEDPPLRAPQSLTGEGQRALKASGEYPNVV